MAKINKLKYELLENPPYSPDLASSDLWLFSHLKKFMRGKRFSSNDEVIAAVDEYFADLPEKHYRDGIFIIWRNIGINALSFWENILNNKKYFKP